MVQWGWPTQQGGIQGVRFVNGIAEARSIMVPYGTKSLFMDSNEDVFYIKEADLSGSAQVDAFRFEKIEPSAREYVTREEFEELRKAYESVVQRAAAPQPIGEQPVGRRAGQQPDGAALGAYPLDQPAAGQGAGAAPYQGAWDNAAGVGRDGGSGV